jgi:hypothetical protein
MTESKEIARYLRAIDEPTTAPAREPPFWSSRVLRRRAGVVDAPDRAETKCCDG